MGDRVENDDMGKEKSPPEGRSPEPEGRSNRDSRNRSPTPERRRSRRPSGSRSYSRSPVRSPPRRRRSPSNSRSRSPRRRGRSYSRSRSRSRSPPRYGNRGGGRQYPANVPPCRVLGVFGLSMYTSQRAITELMSKYGHVEKVDLILDRLTGRSKGFGFVYFDTVEAATQARNATNGLTLDERTIRVDYSKTKRAHTPTPGIYMGPRLPPPRYGGRRSYSPYGRRSRSRSRSPPRYRRSRSRSWSPRR